MGIILLSTAIGKYIFMLKSPAEKIVDSFLYDLIHRSDYRYMPYLTVEMRKSSFPSIVRENKLIEDYKILKDERISEGRTRVWVSLKTRGGTVQVPFLVKQLAERIQIEALPKIAHLPGTLPLSKESAEGGRLDVYTLDVSGTRLTCFRFPSAPALPLQTPVSVLLLEDYIIDFSPLAPYKLSKILSISEKSIEDIQKGKLPVSPEMAVYTKDLKGLSYMGQLYLPIGSRDVTLYCSDDGIGRIAVWTPSALPRDSIRVVLHRIGYTGLTHDEIKISSDSAFTVRSVIDSMEYSFEQGHVITFKASGQGIVLYKNGREIATSRNRWFIHSADGSPLRVLNIDRSHTKEGLGTPYRGSLEVALMNHELVLVNELPLEEYLYSVVPSEMPLKFGLEALKVQAIAARSYAVRCLSSKGFAEWGAHVDDSTSSQVYNNIAEHPVAIQAVEDTRGLIPVYDNRVIDARFFSTSAGYTAGFHEVWSDENHQFPGTEIPYLVPKPQYPGDAPSLYNEENFRAFIANSNLNGYDRFSPFFRWSIVMSRREIEASINRNLPNLQKAQPQFILTRSSAGNYVQAQVPDDIGELLNLEVLRRGEGGNIMELAVTTTRGVFKIVKELNIRRLLQPVNYLEGGEPVKLYCHDGSVRYDFPLLPSAFVSIDLIRDSNGHIEQIHFTGGGYGHGVGMSQYGTYGLTLLGYSYEEIIEHYYPGTEITNLYANSSLQLY